ncbi:metallopeptidase TldD-related protein [Clostridiaceae bacterium M8S5]|nr:metallopeptidase TldD-related protein [Clostridiaceae bacterium M8S5]
MINNILELLKNSKIDDWKIIETKTESAELFFIKHDVDMNRAKNIKRIILTVYKDFEEDGNRYKGEASVNIYPTMSNEEIKEAIKGAAFSAGFIKNEFYELPKPNVEKSEVMVKSNLEEGTLGHWLPKFTEALFVEDKYELGGINSAELFLNKKSCRVLTSTGIDVSWNSCDGQIEFITNWKEDGEEVELYQNTYFANYDENEIRDNVKEMLQMSKDRAVAKETPQVDSCPVLLSGKNVKSLLNFYNIKAAASRVYMGHSTFKIGDLVQGEDIKGDVINLTLDPYMDNSTGSSPYDVDGVLLKPVEIFKDGVLQRYHGSSRYCQYVNVEPTGQISNIKFAGGSKTIEEMKNERYLEVLAFSDFSVDPLVGDFAGEIRLAKYFDGENISIVTGGSISGNINEVQSNMYFSKELKQSNNFIGPKTLQLYGVNIAGVK